MRDERDHFTVADSPRIRVPAPINANAYPVTALSCWAAVAASGLLVRRCLRGRIAPPAGREHYLLRFAGNARQRQAIAHSLGTQRHRLRLALVP